jgi:hypothetical protein
LYVTVAPFHHGYYEIDSFGMLIITAEWFSGASLSLLGGHNG